MIELLNSYELQKIICGSQVYNFYELEQKGTRYMDGFKKDS